MGQYTFSFLRSEYERIPLQLKAEFAEILSDADDDDENAARIRAICNSMEKAIFEICEYTKDQLLIQ